MACGMKCAGYCVKAPVALEHYEHCPAQRDWGDSVPTQPQYAAARSTSVYVRCMQKDRIRLAFE